MCRLAMMNKEGIIYIEQHGGMLKFLDFLQKQCGGHGNGYLLIKDGEIVSFDKGISLSNEEIIKSIEMHEPDWFLYHTRIASAGSIKDKNCHPFWNEGLSFALMMNGTEPIAPIARSLDKTDTELIFDMIDKDVLSIDDLSIMTSNYMGFCEGGVFLANNKTFDPLLYHDENDAIIVASDVPAKMAKEFKEMDKCIWFEGEEFKERKHVIERVWRSTPKGKGQIIGHMGWAAIGSSGVATSEDDIYEMILEEERNK